MQTKSRLSRRFNICRHIQDKERAISWIMRYISFIILKREYLAKPFRNATEEYIRSNKMYEAKRS